VPNTFFQEVVNTSKPSYLVVSKLITRLKRESAILKHRGGLDNKQRCRFGIGKQISVLL